MVVTRAFRALHVPHGIGFVAHQGVWRHGGLTWAALTLLLAFSGCASRRLVLLENELLRQQNSELTERIQTLESAAPNPEDYRKEVDLSVVDEYLTRMGRPHTWSQAGQGFVRVEYYGINADFGVMIQHFASSKVLFVATSGLIYLREAQNVESMVLLLVQLATLNYDLLIGKFQLNPETGEILISTEIHLDDGLGYATFQAALDELTEAADKRYPTLEKAISGLGF